MSGAGDPRPPGAGGDREGGEAGEAFVAAAAGSYRLQAPLQFASVPRLRGLGLRLIAAAADELTLDLEAVPAVDSAGLALLIDWLASARAAGKRLRYARPPQALVALARLSDVEPLLTG
ncbi:MAG TPA: STAS domain-containing protein [Steroidobacteraceae bacterium]|nr:STAS domain-containing protein [Steroidobacteraceae bacterium]